MIFDKSRRVQFATTGNAERIGVFDAQRIALCTSSLFRRRVDGTLLNLPSYRRTAGISIESDRLVPGVRQRVTRVSQTVSEVCSVHRSQRYRQLSARSVSNRSRPRRYCTYHFSRYERAFLIDDEVTCWFRSLPRLMRGQCR